MDSARDEGQVAEGRGEALRGLNSIGPASTRSREFLATAPEEVRDGIEHLGKV